MTSTAGTTTSENTAHNTRTTTDPYRVRGWVGTLPQDGAGASAGRVSGRRYERLEHRRETIG